MYGHDIEGMGFFHVEVPDAPPPSHSLLAIVSIVGKGIASPEMIEVELNHLCRCKWDWRVAPLPPTLSRWSSRTPLAWGTAPAAATSPWFSPSWWWTSLGRSGTPRQWRFWTRHGSSLTVCPMLPGLSMLSAVCPRSLARWWWSMSSCFARSRRS